MLSLYLFGGVVYKPIYTHKIMKQEAILIKVERDLKRKVKDLALKEGRTISSFVTISIENRIKELENEA